MTFPVICLLNACFKDCPVLLYVVDCIIAICQCVNVKSSWQFHVLICLLSNACYIKTALFALTALICYTDLSVDIVIFTLVVLYYRLLYLSVICLLNALTSCNSYYPGDISCNLFTECLYQNCPVCVDCIALSGCSVLSTILFTQTSCNSYYPVDIPCNLFTECLFQRLTCLHYYLVFIGCSVFSTILSTQTSCNFTIQLTFPVICLLNAYF